LVGVSRVGFAVGHTDSLRAKIMTIVIMDGFC
jgi:hypothetical protein